MYGIGEKYQHLEFEPFEFPETINLNEARWFKNEREFLEFLIRNQWIQRRVGFSIPQSNGLFPDVHGIIFDKDQTKIRVEVEYRAENYGRHGHPFGKADLILSFIRGTKKKIIRGCPVWSFYTQVGGKQLQYCLDKDINFDFLKYTPSDNDECADYEAYENTADGGIIKPFHIPVTQKTEIKRKRVKKIFAVKKKFVKDKTEPKIYVEVRNKKRELKIGDWYVSIKTNKLRKIKTEREAKLVNTERRNNLHHKNLPCKNKC